MEFRKCFVASCNNDTNNSPDKIFVRVRENLRRPWCKAAKTDYFRVYTYFCCEDHFDPARDLKNFDTYKENNKFPVLKPTAKFRYISKSQPVVSPVKTAAASISAGKVSRRPESKQPKLRRTLLKDKSLPSVRRTTKKVLRRTLKNSTITEMKDFSKACRCCLLQVGPMEPIFGSSLDMMLSDLMGFPIEHDDGYPQQICIRCIRKLSSAHNFYETVKSSHKTVAEKSKVKVTKGANIRKKTSVDVPITEVNNQEKNVEMKFEPTSVSSVSCQTEEKFFQKLMLANVQLSRVERASPEMLEEEYLMLSGNEGPSDEELPEQKFAVRGQVEDPESYGYKCPQCLHVANNEAALKKHVKTHLAAEDSAAEAATPAQLCNICGQTFKCRTSLYKHLRFHNGHVFECKYCDKQFAEQSTLKVHLISHSLKNARPFECPACDRTFTQQAALNKHASTMHAAQRAMHQCQQCARSFLYKYSLQKHCLRNHTVTPCNLCGAKYAGMLSLEKHIKTHKDKKQFTFEAEYLEFDEL